MGKKPMILFKDVLVNDKWPIAFPEHIADLPMWKFWEKERMASMYGAIRPTDTVLDIGTCNGDMSAVFATWLGHEGRMILVEPSPDFWPLIKAIWVENKLPLPTTYEVLLANEVTDDWSTYQEREPGIWPRSSENEIKLETGFAHVNERPKIPITTIDELVAVTGDTIDVITMDIEGTEYECLQGGEQTLLRDKPIVFVSVHPEFMWREHHHSPDDLIVMMQKFGYSATYLAFDHEQHYMFKPIPV